MFGPGVATCPWLRSGLVDPAPVSPLAPTHAPVPLLVAAGVTGLEAAALVVLSVAEVFSLTSGKLTMGVSTSLFFLVYGVALGAFGWLLGRRQSWPRAPIVLTQLIQLGVAWSFRSGATTAVSAVLILLAVVVLVGVFHPASLRALADPEEEEPTSLT
jgi:hypothetical protein